MPIRVVCPEGHKILAPDSRAGQRIRCPRCRSELRVPALPSTSDADEPPTVAPPTPPPVTNKKPQIAKKQVVTKKESSGLSDAAKKQRWKGDPAESAVQNKEPAKSAGKSKILKKPASKKPAVRPSAPAGTAPPPLPGARQRPARRSAAAEAVANEPAPPPVRAAPAQPAPPPKKAALPMEKPAAVERDSVPPTLPSLAPADTEFFPPAAPADVVGEEPRHEEPAEPAVPVIGMRHRPERVRNVYFLALVLGALALFGMIPAGMEWLDYLRFEGEYPVARWAWLVLAVGLLQMAYAVYLAQVPDWSTVWSTAIATLATAMLYAMLYAVTLLGDADSQLLGWLEVDPTQTGRASGWCFVMLSLCGIFAYFCGRSGANWRHSEQLRATLGLK